MKREIEDAADLSLIAGVLRRLEAERFTSTRLATLRAELDIEGWPPSRRIAKLNKLIELVDSRRHMVVKVIATLVLWDLHVSYSIEDWRRVCGPAVRGWLSAAGEIEAISSLAVYHYEHLLRCIPRVTTVESPCFDATAIGHPLLGSSAWCAVMSRSAAGCVS